MPTVIVEPVVKDDVEIYGEYVGRIRAQQFVEVRARVGDVRLEDCLSVESFPEWLDQQEIEEVINE